jgi:hypothetical protein
MKKLAALLIGTALAALTAACDSGTNGNGNGNMSNMNHSNMNANMNMNANAANMNAAASRNYNARITKEEYERDRERYGREAKEKGETIGQGLTDGWLWVKTKGALATADNVTATDINVDVNNGVITLRGSLPSKAEIDAAVKVANGIDGKKSVTNQLKVAAGGGAGNANAAHNANHK